ncbi:E3 ubiquitin-protein ligase ORTHRUS 1 [Cercospora beticola]|uniref:E3 ubiquitin-protein ligase ORTHRUS 1 n=1 Tax=Cercospora beticola TaxID=122368 RepID=A0A2G5HIT7_CERBT|nr:E3 ubiquitin-protein ligase ORTHRUS 1 [Cercospora beticola]PIA92113.1 E3 ubiquitin-protein ligase ORTHRUS 1 [Cercospora beticola]WPB06498.1 hypothetical protein RHO25_011155 [Cercospora beticola]CAK1366405.1 unnamed protein product [Cercospora beticola]
MATTSPYAKRVKIVSENYKSVQLLAQHSKKDSFDPTKDKFRPHFEGLNAILEAFEQDKTMTPEFKQSCQIDKLLRLICGDARYHFPQQYVERAKALNEHFEAMNWGGLAEIEDEELSSDEGDTSDSDSAGPSERAPKRRKMSVARTKHVKASGTGRIVQPPVDHPIWGTGGIMHGVALRIQSDGSLSKCLNPLYEGEKKDPKVHSHNGIPVGQWYPNRLAALFAGAHGASQAGIAGSNGTGAYSVVVSGFYEDLDKDEGEIVYYSGSGSHENKDPNQPAESTLGTRILHASLKHKRPMRLLRTSRAVLPWAPAEGLRYDGLYRVEAMDKPKNGKGGLYERFKLVRIAGQLSLDECRKRPTRQELKDYNQINHGYSGFGQNHLVQ